MANNQEVEKFWIDRANEQNNLHIVVDGKHILFSNIHLAKSIHFDQDKNTKETNKAPFEQQRMTPGIVTIVCSVENVTEVPIKIHGNSKKSKKE